MKVAQSLTSVRALNHWSLHRWNALSPGVPTALAADWREGWATG